MPQTRLILGCGYLGRRVARLWREQGDRVFALTRSVEKAAALRAEGLEPIIGDLLQPASLTALPDCDTLLHAVGLDRASGRTQREVSVEGLFNVLKQVGRRANHLIHISSTSVYGQSNGEWVDETSPCEPSRPNGRICLEAEELVQRECGPRSNILRLAGIYGPGRLLRRIDSLKAGEPIGGRPDAWLNLIHVDDAAYTVLACAERGERGRIYLVCDDQPIPRGEYFRELARLAGAPPPQFLDIADPSSRGENGLNKRCSNRRIRNELRVELRYPTINEGLPAALP